MRRRRTTAQEEDTEITPLLREDSQDKRGEFRTANAEPCEELPYSARLSAEPRQEFRFILLGGNECAKHDARNIILRKNEAQQRIHSRVCEMKEGWVNGRLVSVVNSPSFWMVHLASYFFFNRRLETIKNELQSGISMVFPGPHAFLLVVEAGRDTNKERYLLKAIKSEFGKEAIDYTIVLFISDSQPNYSQISRKSIVKKCGGRYHVLLRNNERSVEELFEEVVEMANKNRCKFFVPSPYEQFMKINFESWEKKKQMEFFKGIEKKLREELNNSKLRERDLQKELETSRENERKLREEQDDSRLRERDLQKELKTFKEERDHFKRRESELQKELETSRENERKLREKQDDSYVRLRELQKELDVLRIRKPEESSMMDDVEDGGAGIENEEQTSGATPVRRGSKEIILPDLSENLRNV
uniref:GTPase IMAP family member 7-like n=1 Tax=Astyanax mexicanus TaxID=7994 RepID=A0A3B1JIG7_ASTMX